MTPPKTCSDCRLKSVETTKAFFKRIGLGWETPYFCSKCILKKKKKDYPNLYGKRKPRIRIAIVEDVPSDVIKFETKLLGISKSIWLRKRAPFKRRLISDRCNENDLHILKHPKFYLLKITLESNTISCTLLMRKLKITYPEAKEILGDICP